jgi:hypothetical protein
VYLRRFKRYPADCNPYALEVVQFGSVDQADYYTLSVRGITHYVDGVNAEFASEQSQSSSAYRSSSWTTAVVLASIVLRLCQAAAQLLLACGSLT